MRNFFILTTIFFGSTTFFLGWTTWPYIETQILKIRKDEEKKQQKIVSIRVAKVKKGAINPTITLSASVRAADSVAVMSEVHGQIEKIPFKQGEFVKKGSVLIKLDDRQAKAALSEALAQQKLANFQRESQKILLRKNMGARVAMEKAESDVAVANAAVEKARILLQSTEIKAPFDGEIGLMTISVGAHVSPNQELTKLVKSDPLFVEFQVPESDIAFLEKNQDVEVLVEGFDRLPFQAKIVAIEPYSDSVSHTIKVRALMENPDNKIKDGAFAKVNLSLSQEKEALLIPSEAVTTMGDLQAVFFVEKDTVQVRDVTLGVKEKNQVQVLSGLQENDVVAVDPVDYLYDGAPVRIETAQ